jgi:SAM-dependent methyltransferase
MEGAQTPGTAAAQAAAWGRRARDWADLQEPTVRPLYQSVLEAFDVGHGTRVCDVGCGAGGFLRLASERGALVSGLDATPELLEIARERNLLGDLRQGEIEELPFPDEAFDLVTGFNSFQFAGRPVNALVQARRVVHAGGAVVMAVWGQPEQCESASVLNAVSLLGPPAPPGAPGPFALSPPGALEALVESAGLTAVRAVEVECPMVYADLSTAVRALSSPAPAAVARATVGEAALTEALQAAFAPFAQADGSYRLENVFRYVISTP